MKFFALIAAASAIRLGMEPDGSATPATNKDVIDAMGMPKEPGSKEIPTWLPKCPKDDKFGKAVDYMNAGRDHVVKYPYVGATCVAQVGGQTLAIALPTEMMQLLHPADDAQHCPDFDERHTLLDGRTIAIPYPAAGWNCKTYNWDPTKHAYLDPIQKGSPSSDKQLPEIATALGPKPAAKK